MQDCLGLRLLPVVGSWEGSTSLFKSFLTELTIGNVLPGTCVMRVFMISWVARPIANWCVCVLIMPARTCITVINDSACKISNQHCR